jgi:hypothetical protein
MKLRLLTITSWLLLAACLVAWLRSYLPGELHLRADRGSIFFLCMHRQWVRDMESTTFIPQIRSGSRAFPVHVWHFMGFEVIRTQPLTYGWLAVGVPFWALCVPLAGSALWGTVRLRRLRDLRRPGLCGRCGYDLRETTDRCPECGTPTTAGVKA